MNEKSELVRIKLNEAIEILRGFGSKIEDIKFPNIYDMKPYRTRAANLVNGIILVRLLLIARGASRNKKVKWERCKQYQQQIEPLRSDRQWAEFLSGNMDWLREMIPPRHRKVHVNLLDLQLEAMQILNQE